MVMHQPIMVKFGSTVSNHEHDTETKQHHFSMKPVQHHPSPVLSRDEPTLEDKSTDGPQSSFSNLFGSELFFIKSSYAGWDTENGDTTEDMTESTAQEASFTVVKQTSPVPPPAPPAVSRCNTLSWSQGPSMEFPEILFEDQKPTKKTHRRSSLDWNHGSSIDEFPAVFSGDQGTTTQSPHLKLQRRNSFSIVPKTEKERSDSCSPDSLVWKLFDPEKQQKHVDMTELHVHVARKGKRHPGGVMSRRSSNGSAPSSNIVNKEDSSVSSKTEEKKKSSSKKNTRTKQAEDEVKKIGLSRSSHSDTSSDQDSDSALQGKVSLSQSNQSDSTSKKHESAPPQQKRVSISHDHPKPQKKSRNPRNTEQQQGDSSAGSSSPRRLAKSHSLRKFSRTASMEAGSESHPHRFRTLSRGSSHRSFASTQSTKSSSRHRSSSSKSPMNVPSSILDIKSSSDKHGKTTHRIECSSEHGTKTTHRTESFSHHSSKTTHRTKSPSKHSNSKTTHCTESPSKHAIKTTKRTELFPKHSSTTTHCTESPSKHGSKTTHCTGSFSEHSSKTAHRMGSFSEHSSTTKHRTESPSKHSSNTTKCTEFPSKHSHKTLKHSTSLPSNGTLSSPRRLSPHSLGDVLSQGHVKHCSTTMPSSRHRSSSLQRSGSSRSMSSSHSSSSTSSKSKRQKHQQKQMKSLLDAPMV